MGNVCHPSALVCVYLDWLPRLSLLAPSVLLDALEDSGRWGMPVSAWWLMMITQVMSAICHKFLVFLSLILHPFLFSEMYIRWVMQYEHVQYNQYLHMHVVFIIHVNVCYATLLQFLLHYRLLNISLKKIKKIILKYPKHNSFKSKYWAALAEICPLGVLLVTIIIIWIFTHNSLTSVVLWICSAIKAGIFFE